MDYRNGDFMNDVIPDDVGRLLQRTVILIDMQIEMFFIDTIYFNREGSTTRISEVTIRHQPVWSEKVTYINEDGQKRGHRTHELF